MEGQVFDRSHTFSATLAAPLPRELQPLASLDLPAREVVVALPSGSLRQRVVAQLRRAGFHVIEAVDACDAAALIGEGRARSLILSSRIGPTSAGDELARCLDHHAEVHRVPVLFIESSDTPASTRPSSHLVQTICEHRFRSQPVLVRTIVNQQTGTWAADGTALLPDRAAPCAIFERDRLRVSTRGGWLVQFKILLDQIKNRQLAGPMVPELLRQVNRLFSSSTTTLRHISTFAANHQLLASRLIAVANSAFFGGKNPVRDLKQAVLRLGFEQCATVMQGFALRDLVLSRHPHLKDAMMQQLRKAHFVAIVAEMIARQQGHRQPGTAQMAGLFHNVGVTFFMHFAALTWTNHEPQRDASDDFERPRELNAQACEALLLLAQRHEPTLNALVGRCIELPAGIHELDQQGRATQAFSLANAVAQARWVAEQVLDEGLVELKITPAARALGIDDGHLLWLNLQMPKFRAAAHTYAADLGWEQPNGGQKSEPSRSGAQGL